MKTIGFKGNEEKFVPVGEVVKLSVSLQLALSKAAGEIVPDFLTAIEHPRDYASCSGCLFQPLRYRFPTCGDAVTCRTANRKDSTEVIFIYCDKSGDPV